MPLNVAPTGGFWNKLKGTLPYMASDMASAAGGLGKGIGLPLLEMLRRQRPTQQNPAPFDSGREGLLPNEPKVPFTPPAMPTPPRPAPLPVGNPIVFNPPAPPNLPVNPIPQIFDKGWPRIDVAPTFATPYLDPNSASIPDIIEGSPNNAGGATSPTTSGIRNAYLGSGVSLSNRPFRNKLFY